MFKKFSLTYFKDEKIVKLLKKTDKKILAIWAIECSLRVLPYFEKKYPKDGRPRKAIETLKEWIKNGVFKMSIIRKASLDSHASAREVREDNSARSAARSCGQCVATAHVKTHSMGAAIYALQAIYMATGSDVAVAKEKNWQYEMLRKLLN